MNEKVYHRRRIIFAIFKKLSGKGGCLSFVIAIIVTPFWFAAVATETEKQKRA